MEANNYFVYGFYDASTPWLEFRILNMKTNEVETWKAYIAENASEEIACFLGLAKAQNIIHNKMKNTDDIIVYCNNATAIAWAKEGKTQIDHSKLDKDLSKMVEASEEYISTYQCIPMECWSGK